MILDDVPQAARGFIKCAACSYAEVFRQGDLDTGDVVAIPDWFEKGVGEAEIKDIHDRFFAEEVIDAKDRIFRENRPRHAVQRPSRSQVASKRLLDDDSRVLSQTRRAEPFDYGLKERRRNGEIMCRAARSPQRFPDRGERMAVVIIPTYIVEQR